MAGVAGLDAGRLLRRAREAAGWTQRELADKADVSMSVIQKSEAEGISYRVGKRSAEKILSALSEHAPDDLLVDLDRAFKRSSADDGAPTDTDGRRVYSRVSDLFDLSAGESPAWSLVARDALREFDGLNDTLKARYVEFLLTVSGLTRPGAETSRASITALAKTLPKDRDLFQEWFDGHQYGERTRLAVAHVAWLSPQVLTVVVDERGRPEQIPLSVVPKHLLPTDVKERMKDEVW